MTSPRGAPVTRWGRLAGALGTALACAAEPAEPPFTDRVRFDDVAAASAAGLFAEAWMPAVLPAAAGPIESARDAARPGHCARARFPTASRESVESGLLDYGFDLATGASPGAAGCPFDVPTGPTARRYRSADGGEDSDRFAVVGDGVLWVFDPVAPAANRDRAAPGPPSTAVPR